MSYYPTRDIQHKERLKRKYDRLDGLRALIATWEADGSCGNISRYVEHLRKKMHKIEIQLKNMRP